MFADLLLHRETRRLIALRCRPLSLSSRRVRLARLLSVWSDCDSDPLLWSDPPLFFSLSNPFFSEPLSGGHLDARSCHGAQAGVGCHVLRSDARASADRQLHRANQLPSPSQGVCSVKIDIMFLFGWCFHVCISVRAALSSRVQARSFMMTFTQIRWAQLQPCLLTSGGREGTSR